MGTQKQQEEKVIKYKVTTQTKEIVRYFRNLDEDIDTWLKTYDRISLQNEWSPVGTRGLKSRMCPPYPHACRKVGTRGLKSRMCPPYPHACRKRRLKWGAVI